MPHEPKVFSRSIQPGDTVAYSRSYFDRQEGPELDGIKYARGTVTALHSIANGIVLADVEWDTAGLPKRAYAKDLVKV
jgi:hypothetical protein